MTDTCLTKEEKGVVRTAFKRYHAALQVDNDARVVWLGAVIYAVALRPVLAKPAPVGGLFVAFQVVLLGLSCLWPFALRFWSHERLLRWRDEFFMGHWYLHHIVGTRLLLSAEVDLRRNLVSSNPLLFFLGFWVSRPTLWFCGDMVTYRMKFHLFVIVQPIILALYWPQARQVCQSSVLEHPEQTMDSFSRLVTILRSLTRSPAFPQTPPFDDAMSLCCKVEAFSVLLVALIVPGAVVWYLEQQTWREFGRVDPATLTWEGGPTERQISSIQKKLRKADKDRAGRAVFDGRIVAILYVITATLWQLLDAPTLSFLVKSNLT